MASLHLRSQLGLLHRPAFPRGALYVPFTTARCSTYTKARGAAQPWGNAASNRLYVSHAAPTEESKVVDKSAGRMTYRPQSFQEIVDDAVGSILSAIDNNLQRMEVEFPPVPTAVDGYKGSSDMFIDSNIQLALAAARKLAAAGKRAHVVMPDKGEYDRAYQLFKPSLGLMEGVSLGHLNESKSGVFSMSGLFGGGAPPSALAAEKADVFIITNATCVELPNVQDYVEASVKGRPVVLWNMELDTLRGDLGLLGYPPKDVHYKFLSYFTPVFFLRARDYSKSVAVAPFIVNYSGALFREYPGPWQVMLKQDSGEYACIAEDQVRYNLGEVKEELLAAMGLNTEEEGSTMQFLRRGYKNSTWFEDDVELAQSSNWRS